jgi:hypothetical protein
MNLTVRTLKLAILEALTSGNKQHKFNLIGRGSSPGSLEQGLGLTMGSEERVLAAQAFEKLKTDGLVQATYDDLIDPEAWVRINDAGRNALARKCLDDLDYALSQISDTLVELRAGAWSAVLSRQPDSLRQAAHSGRELIDQTLKIGAPDDVVKMAKGFVHDENSNSGVTRRHRLRHLMAKHVSPSDSQRKVAEKACELVEAAADRLKGLAHSRPVPQVRHVEDALHAAEIALRSVLLREEA